MGSGYSSLASASYLAQQGHEVTVFEKNSMIGGRARQWQKEGFVFDMGPTFYWMPDVFEKFFEDFGHKPSDYYELVRLDPGYEIYFGEKDSVPLSADFEKIVAVFEENEPGSGKFLRNFMKSAAYNYRVAMEKVVYKPGKSPMELVMPATAARVFQFFSSLSGKVRRNIHNPKLRQMLEFPVIFLGAKPSQTPAFYCFMNYADMILGTWHVKGGMFEMINGIKKMAESLGVKICTNSAVTEVVIRDKKITGVVVNGNFERADAVVSGADYHHTESLLPRSYRNYSEKYWNKRVMAPSALLYYVAFDRKIDRISHHTLFFDTEFSVHAEKIYDDPGWPESPLFYTSFPSVSDERMAPEGKDAAVILIPVAAGLSDTPEIRDFYFNQVIERMERLTGQKLKDDILFHESYAISDFTRDYNAYQGNAYGLSNILLQTAFLKPKIYNKKVKNLFYAGQLTVPGPGVPPAVISGKIAAQLANDYLQKC